MIDLEKVLRAIDDINRLRIINLLPNKVLCNENISLALNIEQTNLSKHLIKLVDAGIINYEKNGRKKHYSLSSKMTKEYGNIYKDLKKAFINEKVFENDRLNFIRKGKCSCNDKVDCNCKSDGE
jgi:ArsR family transcriptional regulator